jgi:hypothetical protein
MLYYFQKSLGELVNPSFITGFYRLHRYKFRPYAKVSRTAELDARKNLDEIGSRFNCSWHFGGCKHARDHRYSAFFRKNESGCVPRSSDKTLTESGTVIVSSGTVIPLLNIARREAITMAKGRCEFGTDSMRQRRRQTARACSRSMAR